MTDVVKVNDSQVTVAALSKAQHIRSEYKLASTQHTRFGTNKAQHIGLTTSKILALRSGYKQIRIGTQKIRQSLSTQNRSQGHRCGHSQSM